MIQEGVDIIIGAHPHVVQPSQTLVNFDGTISHVVVYSLGNFVSGMIAPNTYGGQMVKVVVEREPFRRARIRSAEYALIYRHRERTGSKLDFSVVPVAMAERDEETNVPPAVVLNREAYEMMMRFATTARDLFGRYNRGVTEYRLGACEADSSSTFDFSSAIFGD